MTTIDTEVRFRLMTAEDFDNILAIDRKVNADQRALTYQDSFNEVFGGELTTSFVAEVEQQIIGFVLSAITSVPGEMLQVCLIRVIGVDPDHRRQGVGTGLLQMVCNESRTRGVKAAHVMVDQDDKQMQRLLAQAGFCPRHLIDYCKSIE